MANKTNKQTAAKVAAGAKQENKVINTNPCYIFRSLNKKAQGRDKDAKEIEGYSNTNLREMFNRLNNMFNCGGFWWGSVYAVNGQLVTSAKKADYTNVVIKEGQTWVLNDKKVAFVFGGQLYIGTCSAWSENAVINAAKLRLNLYETYIKDVTKLWNTIKDETKDETKAAELAKTINELMAQVAAGTITNDQAAAKVAELMAA